MEGKRVAASPQPCSGQCVVAAKRQRVDASANCACKLQRWEIGTSGNGAFNITNSQEKFRNFQLQEEFDTYDTKAHWFLKLQFLKKRSKTIEIVATRDIVFAYDSGCYVNGFDKL